MDNSSTKICKMCCKEINSKAKKCSYCQQWQGIYVICSPQALGIISVILAYTVLAFFFTNMFKSGQDFTLYKDQIEIVQADFKFSDNSEQKLVVIGTIANNSDIAWEEVNLEVEFYDHEDNLVDTTQEEKYPFVIPPSDTARFKISMERDFSRDSYRKCKVRVIFATELRDTF